MRCHIARFRIHHGFAGCLLVTVGIALLVLADDWPWIGGWWVAGAFLIWIGAVLCWDDRRDLRHWWPTRDQ